LVLNLPGQVGLALVAGLDAIAGNLELGLAVHALAGTGQPFAVILKKSIKNVNTILCYLHF
jgi:hypothetical protein